jgi:hypothetical protein
MDSKLHLSPNPFTITYVLVITNASVFQSQLCIKYNFLHAFKNIIYKDEGKLLNNVIRFSKTIYALKIKLK